MTRPRTNPVDLLRTQFWIQMAGRQAGYKTAYWFWKVAGAGVGDRANWERYWRGQRVPVLSGRWNPVDLVDNWFTKERCRHRRDACLLEQPSSKIDLQHLPSAILNSDIWNILKGSDVDTQDIVAEIKRIGEPYSKIILHGGYVELHAGDFYHKTTRDMLDQIGEFPTFKAIQCIILLIGWAKNLQNHVLHNETCEFFRFMVPEFLRSDSFPLMPALFSALDHIAQTRTFQSWNEYSHSAQKWQEELPRYNRLLDEFERDRQAYFDSMPNRLK